MDCYEDKNQLNEINSKLSNIIKKQKFEIAKTEKCKSLVDDFFSEMTTVTFGDKTALFIWSKPLYVILINNKEVTRSNIKTFDYLWKQAKP